MKTAQELFANYDSLIDIYDVAEWKRLDINDMAQSIIATLITTNGMAAFYAVKIAQNKDCRKYLTGQIKRLLPKFVDKFLEIQGKTPNLITALEEYPITVTLLGHIMIAAAEATQLFRLQTD